MRTVVGVRSLFLVVSLLLLTSGLSAQEKPDIAGTYSGELFAVDGSIEMTMSLERAGRKYVGTYEMYVGDTVESGTLEQESTIDPDVFLFTWADSYGVGKLKVLFSADRSEFYGYWSSDNDPLVYPWFGRKD